MGLLAPDTPLSVFSLTGYSGGGKKMIAQYESPERSALLGAPLTHDFAVISLSNRLTPWEKIEKRLACAAEADLGIVLYNPRSKGRPDNLRMACDILLRYLPEDRPCGVAHSIGREGEAGEYMTLGALRDADVDMFSTVFIGNAMTKMIGGAMVTPRGYRRKEVPDA